MEVCQAKKRHMEERESARERSILEHAERRGGEKPMGPATPEPHPEGLVCWWCVHALPQLPCFHLPIDYDSKLNRFYTKGNFCSWECMKAFAIDMNVARNGEIQSFIAMMRMRALGRYERLCAAPKRTALKIFGGTMTIEEFKSCYGKTPPPVVFPGDIQVIQKVGGHLYDQNLNQVAFPGANVPSVTTSKQLKSKIDETDIKAETLKLKRNKPLERSKSKLETTLGITRKPK